MGLLDLLDHIPFLKRKDQEPEGKEKRTDQKEMKPHEKSDLSTDSCKFTSKPKVKESVTECDNKEQGKICRKSREDTSSDKDVVPDREAKGNGSNRKRNTEEITTEKNDTRLKKNRQGIMPNTDYGSVKDTQSDGEGEKSEIEEKRKIDCKNSKKVSRNEREKKHKSDEDSQPDSGIERSREEGSQKNRSSHVDDDKDSSSDGGEMDSNHRRDSDSSHTESKDEKEAEEKALSTSQKEVDYEKSHTANVKEQKRREDERSRMFKQLQDVREGREQERIRYMEREKKARQDKIRMRQEEADRNLARDKDRLDSVTTAYAALHEAQIEFLEAKRRNVGRKASR